MPLQASWAGAAGLVRGPRVIGGEGPCTACGECDSELASRLLVGGACRRLTASGRQRRVRTPLCPIY
jgi:hypothetical protein